ncbi:hypothetical protein J1P26_20135 [Neobacillus sp. MM2021_6]|uniref:hypothetical protein n=1 Tax=Bacillaceae TaxID=186817 RepID=UPI0014084629|nr:MULTISPECIES: hypothetical protein [Bacillaceae]MBO0962018.1 hypothetical protein [Neobacillus sp. MM2021_6]NHC20287.1 hypothetical protein [Bacillus sp. MM2020_4]
MPVNLMWLGRMSIMNNQEKLDDIFKKLTVGYKKLNKDQIAFAIKEISRVRGDLADILADYAGKDGVIKKQRLSRLLRELDEVEVLIREYGTTAMDAIIRDSAVFASTGINVGLAAIGAKVVAQMERLNRDVFEYVVKRFGEDGLVLSDRVWRLSGDMRDNLSKVIRTDILKGESVSTMIANIRRVHENETWKIKRLVVTEGNTAYRTATAMNASRSEVVTALRVHRGLANRPEHRCTQLEKLDRYGMGPGLYPPTDQEIYKMHVSCTGFLTYELNEDYL